MLSVTYWREIITSDGGKYDAFILLLYYISYCYQSNEKLKITQKSRILKT